MVVYVDETGGDDAAAGVEAEAGTLLAQVADGGNPVTGNAHVCAVASRSRPVDYGAVGNNDVVDRLLLLSCAN